MHRVRAALRAHRLVDRIAGAGGRIVQPPGQMVAAHLCTAHALNSGGPFFPRNVRAIRSFPSSVHTIARGFEHRRQALAERRLGAGTSGAQRPRLFTTSGGCGDVLSVCANRCLPEYSNRSGCKLEWRDGGHDGCSPAAMVAPIARTEHLVQRMALSGRVEDTAARGRGAVRLLRMWTLCTG